MRHKIQRVHFAGAGGAGMAGLAEVMAGLDYQVSGSDMRDSPALRRLQKMGVTVQVGHDPSLALAADCVIYSSALAADNPELRAARARGIPLVARAQMLGELMHFKRGVAICGTHGKTTTASMTGVLLTAAGLDPTCVIGGRVQSFSGNARLGGGEWLVAEADESDASFIYLRPVVAVLTNVDNDHLETYGGDINRLKESFCGFLDHLPFYGAAVVCADDAGAREVAARVRRRVVTYGLGRDAEVRAKNIRAVDGGRQAFTVRGAGVDGEVTLNAAGLHNVQNALAAIAVAAELEADGEDIKRALANFGGVGRRLESHGEMLIGGRRVILIDDYGHHPTEMRATIAALRQAHPARRLVAAFQPHRYSRTQEQLLPLAAALCGADAVFLTEVYAAGESPRPQADGASLAQAMRRRGGDPFFVSDWSALPEHLAPHLKDGDLLLTMGAGSIGGLPALLKEKGGAAEKTKTTSAVKKSPAKTTKPRGVKKTKTTARRAGFSKNAKSKTQRSKAR